VNHFIERIRAIFPDKYITKDVRNGKKGDSTIALAKLSQVNDLGSQTEAGLNLVSDQFSATAITDLPAVTLQKTGTKISYSDGSYLQGFKLVGFYIMDNVNQLTQSLGVLKIPSPDGIIEGGYFTAYSVNGSVNALDTTDSLQVIGSIQNGAELQVAATTEQCDAMYVTASTSAVNPDLSKDVTFVATVQANGVNSATAQIVIQFEFLCWNNVTPTLQ
tara:strand:- start:2845 stop:3498 length:654 start_codon:yes stop_codon:yes gene_type:complete